MATIGAQIFLVVIHLAAIDAHGRINYQTLLRWVRGENARAAAQRGEFDIVLV